MSCQRVEMSHSPSQAHVHASEHRCIHSERPPLENQLPGAPHPCCEPGRCLSGTGTWPEALEWPAGEGRKKERKNAHKSATKGYDSLSENT